MDRGKLGGPRKTKPKGPPPTGELIALGSKPTPMATDPKLPSQQRKLSATGSSLLPSSSSAFAAKKPKLGVLTPLGRPAEGPKKPLVPTRESSVAPILVPASDLIDSILDAEAENNDDRVDSLIVGAINTLKSNKAKPDQAVFLSLMFLAKTKPLIFLSEGVTESFCSLLKRDVSFNFKSKGNPLVVVLTCNILMSAYQEEDNWPDNFVKVFVEDSLGERVWVDNPECKEFVANIQTAFNTRLPTKSGLTSDPSGRPPSSTPEHCPSPTQFGDDDDRGSDLSEGLTTSERLTPDDQSITPRYTFMQESIEGYILDTLKDQLTRRQAMDNLSRNLIRLMTVTCGYAEVRLMAVQRLEMWLQNPKLTRPAQELLMSVCLNCVTQDPQDVEVVSALIRVRLKTKPLINHYNSCMRELLNAHSENLSLVLKHTIYNELSNSRNPNNMSLLAVLFQHSPEEAAKFLAVVFQELLTNREDYLRAVRALLREIIRALRGDLNFAAFCRSLMQERSESQFMEMEGHLKERLLLQLTDLICLGCLLSVTAAVKEAASALARGEKKVDLETLRRFQLQSSVIQRDSVWWLHTIAPGMFKLNSTDYVQCIQKVLFMESAESYYSKDNWPPEGERAYLLRLVSEVPVQEDTLMRLLVIGLSRDLPLSAVEALDLADQVVRRAASLHSPDFDVLPVERIQLVDAVLNLCAYHHPENIQLPQGYEPPTLAISNLYWKGWMLLLTVSAFNPANIGHAAWEHYPQLKCFMEMVMTNDYDWPPGTLATEEKKAELINKELQICELEKQEILEFESHLAAASTKVSITEANSLLIAQLISMDPSGVARRPPPSILQQLRSLNKSLKLGHLLCRCRAPDFLLDIIQRQGTSQSMPWLAELVESSEGSMEVLPVQCLCEFLLHDIGEEAAQQEDEELLEMEKSKMEMERLKQKSRKQDQLRRRLQTLLYGPDSQPNQTHEVLQYFLRRLGAQQRAGRNLAAKALSMLLAPRTPPRQRSSKDSSTSEAPEQDKEMAAAEEEEDAVTMVMEEEAVVCPPELKGFHWLLVELPKLPHFNIVLATTVYALRQACQTETDPMAVSAYMLFLSQHAPPVVSDMADLALDMATVIVERPTIIAHLMPRGVGGRDGGLGGREEADIAFCALLAIYIQYFKMVLQPQGEPAWSESQDQIFLRWSTGEGATMHILVVHAMIILLTYGEPRGDNEYNWLLEVWFPIQGQPPAAYLVDTSEEALLLPDWLKLRMIRSHVQRLVDAALLDLDPAQLVLFVQSFGIPMDSMSKLLICLDEAVTHNPLAMQQAVVDKAYMSQLVEVQHMRGVVGGEKFKAFLNDNGSLSTGESTSQGAVVDVEMISPVEEERGLSRRPQPSYRPPSTEAGWMQEIVKLFPVDPGVQITSAMKKDIVKGIQLGLSKEISAVTRGDERRESLGDILIATILQMCGGDYSIPFTSSLHQNSHLSCPIFRLLMARENSHLSCPIFRLLMAREVRLTCPSHLSVSPVVSPVCVGGGLLHPVHLQPPPELPPVLPHLQTPHGPRGKTHLSISPVYPHLSVSPVWGGGGLLHPVHLQPSPELPPVLPHLQTPHGPRGKTHLSILTCLSHLCGGDYCIPFTSSLHQNSHLSCPIFRLLMAREVRLTCPSHLSVSPVCVGGGDYSIPFTSSLHQNSHLSCPIFRLLMAREVRHTCPSHLSILTCLSHLCGGGDFSIPFTSSLHQNSHLSCPIFRLLMAREVRLTCPSHLSILTCLSHLCGGGGGYSIPFTSSLHQNSHLSCPIFRLLMAREVRLTCPSHLSILTCLSHLCGGGGYSIPFTSSLHQNSHLSCPIFRLLMARETPHGPRGKTHLSISPVYPHLSVSPEWGGGDYSIPFTSSLHQNSHLSCPIFRLLMARENSHLSGPIFRLLMAREVRLTCSISPVYPHLSVSPVCVWGGGDYSIPFTSSLHQNSHLSCPIFRLLMAREVRLTCPSHLSILTCLSHLCVGGGDYSIPFTSSLHQNSHLSCPIFRLLMARENSHLSCPIFRLLMAREVRLTCPSHLSVSPVCVGGGDYSIPFTSSLHQNSHLSCPIFRLLMAREVRHTCPSHLSILTCLSHLCGGGDFSIPFTSSLHQNSHLSCPIFRLLMAREVRLTCPSHLSILTCLSHLCGGGGYSIPFTSSLHQNSHLSCPIFRLLMAREVRLTCPSHLSILTCLSHLCGGGGYSIPFTSSLHQNSHLSCPIFRLLMAREVRLTCPSHLSILTCLSSPVCVCVGGTTTSRSPPASTRTPTCPAPSSDSSWPERLLMAREVRLTCPSHLSVLPVCVGGGDYSIPFTSSLHQNSHLSGPIFRLLMAREVRLTCSISPVYPHLSVSPVCVWGGGDYSIPFTSSLHQNSHLSCPIFRLLMARENSHLSCPIFRLLMAREVRLTCPSHLSILTCLSHLCVCGGGLLHPVHFQPPPELPPVLPHLQTPHGPRGKTHLSILTCLSHLCGGGDFSIPFTSSLHQNSHLSCPIFRLLMARETPHGPRGKTHLSISPVYPYLSILTCVCVGGGYSIPFTSSLHQNSHLSCPIFRLLMARENVMRKRNQSSGFPALVSRLVKYHSSRGTLTTVLKQYHRQLAPVQKDINSTLTTVLKQYYCQLASVQKDINAEYYCNSTIHARSVKYHDTRLEYHNSRLRYHKYHSSRGTLTMVLKQYHQQLALVQKDINVLSALQAVLEAPYQHQQNLVRQAIAAIKHADPTQPLDFSLVHRVCALLCRFNSPLLEEFLVACLTLGLRLPPGHAGKGEVMTQSHTQLLARMLMEQRGVSAGGGRVPSPVSGLLVDWLETSDTEIVSTCPDHQLHLLFARDGGRSSTQPYLLALLTHQTNYDTLHRCIDFLLQGEGKDRISSTAALDFLWACIHIPKVWQGRDTKVPQVRNTPVFTFHSVAGSGHQGTAGSGHQGSTGEKHTCIHIPNVWQGRDTKVPQDLTAQGQEKENKMASSFTEQICEDLTCSICLELLTRPKVLPCQHTFCQGCIEHHIRGGPQMFFRCPYCRLLARLPPMGVLGLPDNRMASSLCEKLKQELGESRPRLSDSAAQGSCSVAASDVDDRHGNQLQTEPPQINFDGEGPGTGEFRGLIGVTVSDEGEIFVADHLNQRIQVFNQGGMFAHQLLTAIPNGEMIDPRDLALDGLGNLWVVGKRWVVRKPDSPGLAVQYTKQGMVLEKFDLQGIRWTRGVAVDTRRNHILITQTTGDWDDLDKLGGVVQVFRPDGTLVGTVTARNAWWSFLSRQQRSMYPLYHTVDGDGKTLITDCENHCVLIYDEDGQFLFQFGGEGSGEGQLKDPHGICTDGSGNIVVADTGNSRVELFDKTGKFLRHVARDAQQPRAVAMAAQGQLRCLDKEKILQLRPSQLCCLVDYILQEAGESCPASPDDPGSLKESLSDSIQARLPLLLSCCHGNKKEVSAEVLAYLQKKMTGQDKDSVVAMATRQFLLLLYIRAPHMHTHDSVSEVISMEMEAAKGGYSQSDLVSREHETRPRLVKIVLPPLPPCGVGLDSFTHRLLSVLGNCAAGKVCEDRMYDTNILCRKLATVHPALLLRQLPMIAALLRGRVHLNFDEFVHRHHFLFFTHVLGLLELLVPHVFRKEHPLEDVLESYFDLLKEHYSSRRELGALVNKVIQFLHQFTSNDPQRAVALLQKHSATLHHVSKQYPDLSLLKSLLAGISLPSSSSDSVDETSSSSSKEGGLPETGRASPIPLVVPPASGTPWTAVQLAPFLKRIKKGQDHDDVLKVLHDLELTSKRRVDVLEHFLADLKRLMSDSHDDCRNIAHNLVMRHIKSKPSCAAEFLDSYLHCLDTNDHNIIKTTLRNLADYIVLCQEHSNVLVRKAFAVGVQMKIDTSNIIADAINMLRLEGYND
ncbi:INTS1 [Branchiostoma lanceolatum]|uniref:RING-type E3 ubiquitin transferase n=1 Tax=Branchiostoma lanceolatum TaxID=7740 RepID=A0A8K0ABT7_BRALA|nr:INTS1 [Branchiostoma lanceolatum]